MLEPYLSSRWQQTSVHHFIIMFDGEKTCLCFLSVALQKPLRRIEIEEVSGKATVPEVESSGSKTLIQEVVPEEDSSPLSTSPSAKIIKIEEMADAPSHVSEKLVTVFNYWLKPFDTFQSLCRLLYLCFAFAHQTPSQQTDWTTSAGWNQSPAWNNHQHPLISYRPAPSTHQQLPAGGRHPQDRKAARSDLQISEGELSVYIL